MWSVDTVALIAGAFILGGLVKGAIGVGFVSVVLSVLAVTVGLREAIILLVIPGIFTNIWQALVGDAFFEIVKRLWTVILTTSIGIWFGVSILATADTDILITVLGAVLIAYSLISLRRPQIPGPGDAEVWMSPLIGAIGGFLCGLTGSYIVPGVLYIQALGLKRDVFIQAMGLVFLVIASVVGASMWGHGLVNLDLGLMSIAAIIPTTIGMFIGQKIRTRLSEERFRQVFFVAMALVGVYMIVKAMA